MSTPAVPDDQPERARTLRRAISASAIGNMTEWFDYGVYAYAATYIAKASSRPATTPRPR